MTDRFAVASPEWMAAMIDTVGTRSGMIGSCGINFVISERFTDLPPGIDPNDESDFAWHIRIADGAAEAAEGLAEPSDLTLILAYRVAAMLGGIVCEDNREAIDKRDRIMVGALEEGNLRRIGTVDQVPEQLRAWLDQIHDIMARRTIAK